MARIGVEAGVSEAQSEFLLGEINFLTVQAALSTRSTPIYAEGVIGPDRAPFRKKLKEELDRLAAQYKRGRVSDGRHFDNIEGLAHGLSSADVGELLHENKFRVGIAQKALNLNLKYRWCLGVNLVEPPHCPFDSIVIGKLDDCDGINFTEFDDIETYKRLVKQARIKAGDLSLAEWELRLFNRR